MMRAMKNYEIKKGRENKFLKKMRKKGLIDPWVIPTNDKIGSEQKREATNN